MNSTISPSTMTTTTLTAAGAGVSLNMDHPHPVAWFEGYRREIFTFVGTILSLLTEGKRHILVKAPVKSGKREIVECISAIMTQYVVKYITALNRVDVKTQKTELELYDIVTHVITAGDGLDAAVTDVSSALAAGQRVICCFDECDYGAGKNQKMSTIYSKVIDDASVVKIYFSATGQETEASNVSTRADYEVLPYVPPPSYHGAKYFLEAGLVFNPAPFFEDDQGTLDVSAHGIKVIQESIQSDRHIGVVRTPRAIRVGRFKDAHVRKALEKKLQSAILGGKKWEIIPVDEKDSHDWESTKTQRGYVLDTETNYLFVIHQTCTRGTDLKGWHRTLAFWHDQRMSERVNLNTMIQAILRPSHYGDRQAIRMYVDERALMVEAGTLDVVEYLEGGGKAPTRTKWGKEKAGRRGGYWGVPIKVNLPNELLESLPLPPRNASDYEVIAQAIQPLLGNLDREVLDGRELVSCVKRGVPGWMTTVEGSYNSRQPQMPNISGRLAEDSIATAHERYWIDIAVVSLSDSLPRGTAFITYGLPPLSPAASRASTPKLQTTPASMFESKRGEL
jgi:hypothetical protein